MNVENIHGNFKFIAVISRTKATQNTFLCEKQIPNVSIKTTLTNVFPYYRPNMFKNMFKYVTHPYKK